ncbi:DNA sulfur modification protein DndD [Oceanobacillus luteolus]|uniref:DNA sulfur modification protein DndD n=1 Tax=Oceanobacillus luteolus TaxID=1274358 RepID=UPI00203DC4FB|nr:DNA sulfur modification protein DndD [Oceanobacillus luteolus]MCM3741912.1 DNA sulfur modification protein DndD [Oceanobacillus luteolus]
MLFKEIELTNIGPYEGTNTFSFNTDENKNTVLIGGKNGSGKTTFLNSVRLALYGPLAYGFRTHTQTYLSTIETLLNNKAKNNGERFFKIKLGFTTVEEFKRISVEIIRSWTLSNSSVKEHVEIFKNRSRLSEIEKDNFLEKLRVTFPPSLLELCFFDGEDITKLSNEDNLSSYLKELSSRLFNLDLFQSLEQNLVRYLSEDSKSNHERKLEEERDKVELNLKTKIDELKDLKNKTDMLTEQLTATKENYRKTREEFSIHGGLLFEERENIQKEILKIESDRKQANESVKEFIAKDLPFFLALPVLNNLVNQLESEESYYISSIIEEKLNTISFQEIEEVFSTSLDSDKKEKILTVLRNELTVSDDIPIIHNASKTETNQVLSLSSQINIKRLQKINQILQQNSDDLSKLSLLNRKLKDNERTSEFNEMIESMEKDSIEISKLENILNNLLDLQEKLHEEIDMINKQYERVKKELHNIYKKKSSFHITEKALTISRKFQEDQLRKKVRDIEYFSTKMIKGLMRKENFIKRIYIDHETFEVSLIDQDSNTINKSILSAGENELLVLSIIWGTIHSSSKELPIVLDTLLGRLDLEHKASVINNLIPQFGEQCIILATNSEITEDLFHDLSPYVSNHYTLNYDTNNKHTKIENHFFNRHIKGETLNEF